MFPRAGLSSRMSTTRMTTKRSSPTCDASRLPNAPDARCGASNGTTTISPSGRSWQASRTGGCKAARSSTACSPACGSRRGAVHSMTRMRQVEQRPRPPQMLACGTRPTRLASSTVNPIGTRTLRCCGYLTRNVPPQRSRQRRTARASRTRLTSPMKPTMLQLRLIVSAAFCADVPICPGCRLAARQAGSCTSAWIVRPPW